MNKNNIAVGMLSKCRKPELYIVHMLKLNVEHSSIKLLLVCFGADPLHGVNHRREFGFETLALYKYCFRKECSFGR